MFEQASKMKLRFATAKGLISVEDLWDLPLTSHTTSLDNIARGLNRQIKDTEEESFVVKHTTANTELHLALDILKHIIAIKITEKEARKVASQNKVEREKIMSAISDAEDTVLKGSSVEDLKKMLEKLD